MHRDAKEAKIYGEKKANEFKTAKNEESKEHWDLQDGENEEECWWVLSRETRRLVLRITKWSVE